MTMPDFFRVLGNAVGVEDEIDPLMVTVAVKERTEVAVIVRGIVCLPPDMLGDMTVTLDGMTVGVNRWRTAPTYRDPDADEATDETEPPRELRSLNMQLSMWLDAGDHTIVAKLDDTTRWWLNDPESPSMKVRPR